jgi:rhomboid protease GlpG
MKQLPFLTLALIMASVGVALSSSFGTDENVLKALLFAAPDGAGLEEIEAGQVWRLVTPIFIHFGLLHLLFNMMWTLDLGREIEARKGPWFLGGFVVVVGVAGNLAQYLASGPAFGGMSGVVYGLLAYIWMRKRLDPKAGYVLHQYDVITCIGWYFLCWTGLLGPIGNWAHTAGLIGGLAWGYLDTTPVRSLGGLQPTPGRPLPSFLMRRENNQRGRDGDGAQGNVNSQAHDAAVHASEEGSSPD